MTDAPLLSRVHDHCQRHRDRGDKVIGVTFNPTGWEQVQEEKDAWMEDPPDAPNVPVTVEEEQYEVFEVKRIPAEVREDMPVREQEEIKRDFEQRCMQEAQARAQLVDVSLGDILGEPL